MGIYGGGPSGNGTGSTIEDFYGHTFALTYVSRLNESFTTGPIQIPSHNDVTQNEEELASMIELELMALPHSPIERVHVNLTMGYEPRNLRFIGKEWDSVVDESDEIAYISFTMEFTGRRNQGDMKLLTLHYKKCIFCNPQLGVNGTLPIMHLVHSDYDTGFCDCFEGYY